MTSYDNEYNRSLRNKVMGLDVANIGNDRMQAAKTPLRQGGAGKSQRRKDASLLDDVDFRQGGLSGQGFFDDLLSGLNKGAQIANTSLDLYDKVGKTFGKKGMGMSGGVRRGAELSDVMAPQGVTGKMLARAPIAKGSRKGSALLAGSGRLRGGERMTGDNYTPNWRQIEAEQAKDGFIGAGDDDMEGAGFFDDLLGTIGKVAQVAGPVMDIAGRFGAGQSGGKKLSKPQQKRLALRIAELQGRRGAGAGTYGMPGLLGMEGSGPISDLGIPGLSQIAGLFGLGMSGGAADGAQDPAFKIPAPQATSDALASAFLGGRHPSKVSKEEKKMLFMKALADAKMHSELGNLMQARGRGLSGGALPLMQGLGLSGGDFFSDLLGTLGNVAHVAGPILNIASKFGAGDVREVGGAYQPMQGSGLTDMPQLNQTPVRYSYGKMGNIAGMANGAGMPSKAKKMKGGYLQPPPTQVGVSMSGMGQDSDEESESDEEMDGGDAVAGIGAGKGGWINHVKAYARAHNCSYKDALKRAGASYRGKGVSGGDFLGDVGNVVGKIAPFLEFL
jgi:hypothetical protein